MTSKLVWSGFYHYDPLTLRASRKCKKNMATWLLFSAFINNMGFVLFWHQHCEFCFGQGKERLDDFWRGCVNLHTPRSHQSSLKKSTEKLTSDKARQLSDLGRIKMTKRSQREEPGPSLHDRRCVGETAHCPGGDCPSLLAFCLFWSFFICLSFCLSLLTDELWRGLLLEPLLVAGS